MPRRSFDVNKVMGCGERLNASTPPVRRPPRPSTTRELAVRQRARHRGRGNRPFRKGFIIQSWERPKGGQCEAWQATGRDHGAHF